MVIFFRFAYQGIQFITAYFLDKFCFEMFKRVAKIITPP
jgi:hypothetical protein